MGWEYLAISVLNCFNLLTKGPLPQPTWMDELIITTTPLHIPQLTPAPLDKGKRDMTGNSRDGKATLNLSKCFNSIAAVNTSYWSQPLGYLLEFQRKEFNTHMCHCSWALRECHTVRGAAYWGILKWMRLKVLKHRFYRHRKWLGKIIAIFKEKNYKFETGSRRNFEEGKEGLSKQPVRM